MPEWSARLLDLPWDTIELMRAGGKIIPPITVISIWMWFLILRKFVELRAARRERLLLETCLDFAPDRPPQPSQGWLARLLAEFQEQRSYDAETDRQLLTSLLKRKAAQVEKHVPTILMLASVAPLLGLLGTVTGMIATFDAITLVGAGNPRTMASGISEALITTLYGLAVAIPGVMIGSFLNRRVQRFQTRLEELGLRLCRLYQIDRAETENMQGEVS